MLDAIRSDRSGNEDDAPTRLRLKLFGQMEARSAAGHSVLPRVRKTRALLAVLALSTPRPILRQPVSELLWSRRDRDQARASLRQAMHDLQEHLAPIGDDLLCASREHVGLRPEGVWIDVREVTSATAANPAALGLLQNVLLEDLIGIDPALDAWLDGERTRIMRGARLVAEAVLTEQTEPAAMIAAAEQLLLIDTTHEGGWRALMQAHAARGEHRLAIDAFERCTSALAAASTGPPSLETLATLRAIRDRHPAANPPRESEAGSPALRTAFARSPGARLGVMPFRSLDGGRDDQLGLGMAEEITTSLAGFRMISLLASTSLAHLGEERGYGSAAWRQLELDFLVTGTVQRGQDRVRIMAQLLDMHAGGEIAWARRFEREAVDMLALQDDIAAEIAAQIDPELLLREGRRAVHRQDIDPTAHDLVLRAIPAIFQLDRDRFLAAGQTLQTAVARDQTYAAAHAWWAYWHIFLVGQGWSDDPPAAIQRAGDLSERAIMFDPSDARAVTIAGHVRSFLHRQHEEAEVLHERALSLNPNLPIAWVFSGLTEAWLGRHDEAIRRILQAKRLSPFDPHSFFFDSSLIIPYWLRGDFEVAADLCRRGTELQPGLSTTFKSYLTVLGHLGRTEEAALIRERLLRLEPQFTVSQALARTPLRRPKDRDLYATGLRRGGLPE